MTVLFKFTVGAVVLGTTDAYRVRQKGQWNIWDIFSSPGGDGGKATTPAPAPPPPAGPTPAPAPTTTVATTTRAPRPMTTPAPHEQERWHFVCNGFLEGARTRTEAQALGRGLGANNLEMCKAYCTAHNLCNAVTFDVGAGACWMETTDAKPTTATCDHNTNGLSFWLGQTTDGTPFESINEEWTEICNGGGYIQGTHPGRHGLGQIDSGTSVETCQDACNAHWQCNTAIFDGTNCWIENIPLRPSAETCNDASWAHSMWRGPRMLTEIDTFAPSNAEVGANQANLGVHDDSCGASRMRFDEGCFYKCETDLPMQMVGGPKKGMALDDTTLHWCPDNMHFHWPNTDEPVSSFRMFKAWSPWWNEPWTSKEAAWEKLNTYLEATNAQVLVGTQISCSEEEDDADWENVKGMMRIFGPEQIMGLAIGNELELLWTKGSIYNETVLPDCLDNIWNRGYFINKFKDRVRELDEMGPAFRNIPVTSVFGGFILAEPGWPFYERTDQNIARVNTFINFVDHEYGDRYVHTINLYPYFEEAFVEYDDPSSGEADCYTGLERALCMGEDDPNTCTLTWMVGRMRQRLHALGRPDARLWLGETGWSYPVAHTLATKMRQCPEWSSPASKTEYYQNFLKWDMEMNGRYKGPDHIFFFAMRDSSNFGFQEGFGLVGDGDPHAWCTNTTCEMQQSSLTVLSADIH